jgi:hypothetical protein
LKQEVAALRMPIYAAWVERLSDGGWLSERAEVAVRSGAALVGGLATRRLWAEFDAVSREVIEDWIAAQLQRRSALAKNW